MNLTNIDLNLFLVLATVLEEGSATRAAKRLRVTQSAVSNALGRLREHLGDPLVVRSGRGLVPTPKAQAFRPQLDAALAGLRGLVEAEDAFDAARSTRRFTLACADHHEVSTVPRLLPLFRARLPKAQLRVVSKDFQATSTALATGGVDAALTPKMAVPPGLHAEELFAGERPVLIARRDHPKLGRRLTPALFNALDHVDVLLADGEPTRGHTKASAEMAEHGLVRRVVVSMPHFTSAALLVARTELVGIVPSGLAVELSRALPLRTFELPFELPGIFRVFLTWHTRTEADPGARFFRQVLRDALGSGRAGSRTRRA